MDDGAVVPGDERQPYTHSAQARQILNDAEDDLRDWQPEPEDQHAHDQKESVQLSSPTTVSSGGELSPREATHGGVPQNVSGNTGGGVADTTSTAQPQGEPESAKRRAVGGGARGGVGQFNSGVYWHHRAAPDAEIEQQSPQQQLEGSTLVTADSPVSSVGGWRRHDGHGGVLSRKQSGLAF